MNAIPGGEIVAAFPAEPTRECVRAASAGQGRPASAACEAGCLDGRMIRRDTDLSSAQSKRENPDRLCRSLPVLACGELHRA
jgi:hypothetical protein